MNWSPNLIFYFCIAKDTTILAEFNSKDVELHDLATKCLERTPAFHSVFSHTTHGKTYMFFICDPFVYFGIFDESLEKQKCLLFLKRVKDIFTSMIDSSSSGMTNQRTLSSHCFQGDLSPVFHRLVGSNLELNTTSWPVGLKDCEVESSDDFVRRKKLFFEGGNKEGLDEEECDVLSIDEVSRVQKVWNKQVMVVLSTDLVVCAGLFVIWLWFCDGFQCVAN